MTSPTTEGIYNIKDPSDYIGGFLATGIMAIVQVVTPLLLGQIWKREDLKMAGHNPWFAYAWKAMQAGGTVSFGLQSLGFLLAFIFDLNIFERLAYIGIWFTHGAMFGQLSAIGVVAYFIAAIVKYKTSTYEGTTEMWITMSVFAAVQIAAGIVGLKYAKDTILYLVAGEVKDICENYGALCGQLGVLEKNNSGDSFDEVDGDSLVSWAWDN